MLAETDPAIKSKFLPTHMTGKFAMNAVVWAAFDLCQYQGRNSASIVFFFEAMAGASSNAAAILATM